jgi:ubiquinone/menaquinone biosynthesis C-methylase UbiE
MEEVRLQRVYADRKESEIDSWFHPGYLFMMQERERRVLQSLRAHGLSNLATAKILEVGCGSGFWLNEFIKWGARPENLTGVDLLADRIEKAKRDCPARVRLECRNAAQLNFPDSSFDLVLQSTVFTSILDGDLRRAIAREMIRIAKNGGMILWYDFHVPNPRNANVQPVRRKEIYRLFPSCRMRLQRITLAPPIVRLLAPRCWLACWALSKIPWLCTHYLGVIQKPIGEEIPRGWR